MKRKRGQKSINLALQGGGAHGAFTWGVLDRILEDGRLHVEGVSATSAGAMNAAMLKTGLENGGRDGARDLLARFWTSVVDAGRATASPLLQFLRAVDSPMRVIADAMEASPAYRVGDAMTRLFSPYDLNPFNINPLRQLLADIIDFDAVCRQNEPRLFVAATNVRTGKIKVFQGEELSVDALLASACMPTVFQAVEIPDPKTGRTEAYWDGGFVGNPPLYPLFYETRTSDVVIVHINPIERVSVPRSADDIVNRMNEISFNSSLLRELRTVHFVQRLIAEGKIRPGEMKNVLIHSIDDDETMRQLNVATKMQADAGLIETLRDAGRAAMDGFLTAHFDDLGQRSTTDLKAMYD